MALADAMRMARRGRAIRRLAAGRRDEADVPKGGSGIVEGHSATGLVGGGGVEGGGGTGAATAWREAGMVDFLVEGKRCGGVGEGKRGAGYEFFKFVGPTLY
jgi:hypothetical protein